jgi:tRNA threonylcarbamoyladenosine biosynthesis protein TsaB
MLLALDTATRTLSLALHDGEQVIAEATWQTSGRHTVELTPAIHTMLGQAGLAPANLTLIALSQGPGSFNGLRVGFGTAKGLGTALDIPIIAVPTLDVVAAAQPRFEGTLIAVAQAGRGRVVAGSYDWRDDGWQTRSDVQIIAWDALFALVTTPTLISGEVDRDGMAALARATADARPIHLASPAIAVRRAGFLAQLAWDRWRSGRVDDPTGGAPFYLHQPGVPHP